MSWIYLLLCVILLGGGCASIEHQVPRLTKPQDSVVKSSTLSREKRNNVAYDIERRIANGPSQGLTLPNGGMYPPFFPPGTRPYTYYRKAKPQPPPYAVSMDPLTPYSQRDPLYDPNVISSLPLLPNDLPRSEDQATDNNHLKEHFYGPPKTQYIERPVYIKEPEPIIEIIIKEANTTTAPIYETVTLPPKKKKEEVQVFYVKYKKNPHGIGKDSVIYDKPIPALSPIQDERIEDEVDHSLGRSYGGHDDYLASTVAPPQTTTIRAIIKPDSETYHADTGIHVTFGGEHHTPRAEKYSHDDDIVESAPQPAVQHPESRQFANNGPTFNSPPSSFTQEYTPEHRVPQPYRPFQFNQPQRAPNFQQSLPTVFNNGPLFGPNFNAPPSPPNRFPVNNYVVQRSNFNPPPSLAFKQGLPQISKPYQFERPNGQFQFARQQTLFNQSPQPSIGNQEQPPFIQKPTFGNNFGPPRETFKLGPQGPQLGAFQQNHPQPVFHQSGNSFSFQTNFAEPIQPFNQPVNQQHFPKPSNQNQYQTITPGRLLVEQQKQQQQQGPFNTAQAPPLLHHPPQFNQNQFQSPSVSQSHLQIHSQSPIQSLPPNIPLQSHNHIQNQPQSLPQLNLPGQPPNNFIPPGGQLIHSLPKYEQHISFSSNGDASLTNSGNYTASNQQFPIEFSNLNHRDNSVAPVPPNNFPPSFQAQQVPSSYVTSPTPSTRFQLQSTYRASAPLIHSVSTTTTPKPTTTTTTTPKPIDTTTINLKDLNIQLPDEVPDDLREQLLSSGILKNAQISVLDYDKVGDIPISALPPDQLANFYSAGGAQQIAAASEMHPTIVKPDGSSVAKQDVELKVVRYDPEQGKDVHKNYVKQGSTQIDPVVLDDETYNRYLPLRVSGAKFPIPEVPELKGKHINSVVVLAPVDYNFYKQRITRATSDTPSDDDDVQLIKNQVLKQLLQNPTRENYEKFFDDEIKANANQQSVILLVIGTTPYNREIFMYDAATKSVSKLSGELSSAFVDAAETSKDQGNGQEDTNTPEASDLVETKVPVPLDLDLQQSVDMELQADASNIYETKVRIIDPMQDDLEAEGSEQLEQFVDVSRDLLPAASEDTNEERDNVKTEYQLPS